MAPRRELLPEPFGPSRACVSPGGMVKETFFTTNLFPTFTDRFFRTKEYVDKDTYLHYALKIKINFLRDSLERAT